MSAHTPGPWQAGLPADGGRVNVYADETMSMRIARVDSGPDFGIDATANARLIAAAPELLATLSELLEWIPNCAINQGEKASIERARAAIARTRVKA